MKAGPWNDWIPGVLSKKQVKKLIDENYIMDVGSLSKQLDFSSIDIRVADAAYELGGGCVKPFGRDYLSNLSRLHLVQPLNPESGGEFMLKSRKSYLFKIKERITELLDSPIYGMATAKSSVGRLDVLARLIVDGMDEYEGFDPSMISNGDMYLEVTPMTFDVLVRPGTSLTQLRFFKSEPRESLIRARALADTVLTGSRTGSDAILSADLSPVIVSRQSIVAFSASLNRPGTSPVPMWKVSPEESMPKPWNHWKFEFADQNGRLHIKKDRFYIIRSYEKIWLPAGVAVYCRASDETIGEMRIHYAGFVHPHFGVRRSDHQRGTPLIFEVRGHDIDVSLRHREKMARLEFYRMSEDSEPAAQLGDYDNQTLKLSSFFASWPDSVQCDSDGTVTPLSP
jgi:dCTP deaminase